MRLSGLAGDRRGVSAVEFAMIAPIMVLLYFGLAEITLAMMAERRASHAASAIGDLLAQRASVSAAEVADVFTVSTAVVYPFPPAGLAMRATSVKADASGTPRVVWSQVKGTGMTKLPVGSTVSGMPANFLAANESTVMAEVNYGYDTPLRQIIPRTLNFKEKFYLRPRRSTEVVCADC